MNENFNVYVVDDDPMIQDILRSIIEPHYPVRTFGSAEECGKALDSALPDCLLLDVTLPGMDGYQFCRLLKDDAARRDISVTFISGHDDIDHRLKGYDAGGDDFIVKPFEPVEVLRKIKIAEQGLATRKSLREEARMANELSNIALASMGDSGIVLQFMSKLLSTQDETQVAAEMLDMLRKFSLDGAVQARVGSRAYTLSGNGENQPLEVSVFDHVRTLDRIFEFRSRAVWNFDRITIMISNMPTSDEMLAGRIRDSMATAAQAAAARLESIEVEEKGRRSYAGIKQALSTIEATLDKLDETHRRGRYEISQLMYQFSEDLNQSFVGLGLSDAQERYLDDLIKTFMANLGIQMDQDTGFAEVLRGLSADLHRLTL
jgi:DNA-binding response OmpR family regulator